MFIFKGGVDSLKKMLWHLNFLPIELCGIIKPFFHPQKIIFMTFHAHFWGDEAADTGQKPTVRPEPPPAQWDSSLPAEPPACSTYATVIHSFIVTRPILYTYINKTHSPIELKLIPCRPLNALSQILLCVVEHSLNPVETFCRCPKVSHHMLVNILLLGQKLQSRSWLILGSLTVFIFCMYCKPWFYTWVALLLSLLSISHPKCCRFPPSTVWTHLLWRFNTLF